MRVPIGIARIAALLLAVPVALLIACGGGGSDTPSPPVAGGSLSVVPCAIAAGSASCHATVSWTTANAAAPRVLLGAATLATTASGTLSIAVGVGGQTVALLDGAARLDEATVAGSCAAAAAWDGATCAAFALRTVERIPTALVENGQPISLEVVFYRPPGPGPYPTVIFHHGSTGNGDDPAQFRITYTSETVARYFAERGWMVVFPQRRGRGQSDGIYDEGFTPDRARYSCRQGPALAGLERALQDVDVAVDLLRTRPEVEQARLLAAGVSRGGILAAAHAARRPGVYRGVVNFVGGWLGEGCADAVAVNRQTFAAAGAFAGPTLWLYGAGDPFYSIAHSRANLDAYVAAGGSAQFHVYARAPGLSGHLIINDPALWTPDLDAFVAL